MLAIKRFCYIDVPFIYCTVKPRSSMETRSIQTSYCYAQFALSLGKESPFIFYPLNKVIRSPSEYRHFLCTARSLSRFTGFDCIIFWGGEYRLLLKIESLDNAILEL